MANPRKFSEKIALHNQKQAEETAAFEQIMKEVIGATRVNMVLIFKNCTIKVDPSVFALALRNDHVYVCLACIMLSQHWDACAGKFLFIA